LAEDEFKALVALEMDAVAQAQVDLITKFCDLWLADGIPNQPIRANRETLAAEIGHGRFREALLAWRQLCSKPAT
jgi:hypothetical protein